MSRSLQTLLEAVGLGVLALVVAHLLFGRVTDGLIRRLQQSGSIDTARYRTQVTVLRRVVDALIVAVAGGYALQAYDGTRTIAQAVLASGAVLAVLVGLAITTPLQNLGSGVLLALTQKVRLGDRVTVGDQTGVVDEIHLMHTVLSGSDGKRVFVPNQVMLGTTVVNRSIAPVTQRTVAVSVPIALTASIPEARAALQKELRSP